MPAFGGLTVPSGYAGARGLSSERRQAPRRPEKRVWYHEKMMSGFFSAFNIKKRCASAGVGLWQCPHFLFPVMGFIVILSIVATYFVASRFAEPEIAALVVLVVTAILF